MDDLIDRWVAGDAQAGGEIYRRYYARVRGFAIRLGQSLVDADDIAQEAMVAGLEGLKSGRRPDELTRWLLGIARHFSFRRKRREQAAVPDLPDPDSHGARTLAVRREMDELLEGTMEGLPPRDREVLDLRHKENLSRKEIAARLNVPIETIHARLERAYARLRGALSRHFTTMAFAPFAPVGLKEVLRLRPTFRDAVIARHLEERSEAEAAAKLGVPAATLRARLESAYEMLRCGPGADFSGAREEYRRAP